VARAKLNASAFTRRRIELRLQREGDTDVLTRTRAADRCHLHAVVVPVAGYQTPRSMKLVEGPPLSAAGKVLELELRKPYWENQKRVVH
jgi:hypothetical protein